MKIKELNTDEEIFSSLLESLPEIHKFHSPENNLYKLLKIIARNAATNLFGKTGRQFANFGPIGRVDLPFFSMGSIDSTNLFGLDELIIFSFYLSNKDKYKYVADLGANIGLHSIILSKLGFKVKSYEPDPIHFERIKKNIDINIEENKPKLFNKAVSTEEGKLEFIRVLGNTTGSHIAGAKSNLYGELDKFEVDVIPFKDICDESDFIKIDVEGHEAEILLSTKSKNWENTEAIVEVGSEKNSILIFNHFKKIGINLFSQKNSWNKVDSLKQMPTSYKDGSLFISSKNNMQWI